MIGNPKYKAFNKVEFEFIENEVHIGVIWIVDELGTYFDKSDVSYDIYVEEENMLYKHIPENCITKCYE